MQTVKLVCLEDRRVGSLPTCALVDDAQCPTVAVR